MTFVKINETLYPATIKGKLSDDAWDNRDSKAITLEMDYATASNTFVDGAQWSIIQTIERPVYDEQGNEIDIETHEVEYDNTEYSIAGDIIDHRDGTITAKMGKLTVLEEAYELMLGGIE